MHNMPYGADANKLDDEILQIVQRIQSISNSSGDELPDIKLNKISALASLLLPRLEELKGKN